MFACLALVQNHSSSERGGSTETIRHSPGTSTHTQQRSTIQGVHPAAAAPAALILLSSVLSTLRTQSPARSHPSHRPGIPGRSDTALAGPRAPLATEWEQELPGVAKAAFLPEPA